MFQLVLILSETKQMFYQLSFWPRRLVCATRGGVVMRSWPLLLPTFALLSLSPLLLRLLLFIHLGKLPRLKICFPRYFGITRRYMQKKFLLGYFYFLVFSQLFTASVQSRSPGPPAFPGVFCLLFS